MIPRNLVRFLLLILYGGFWLPTLQKSLLEGQVLRSEPVNLVVQIEGQLKLKRPRWAVYAPAVFATNLQAGDLLDLGKSSSAKVVCSDLTLHQVPIGIGAVPCSPARVVLKGKDGSSFMATRGWASDDSCPVVLSPRNTKLITTHPTLRWTAVKGARKYTVIVRGKNLQWSTVVTSGTELAYPQGAPRLEAEVDYKVSVVTDSGCTRDEPGVGLRFSVLKSNDKKSVMQEQERIENLGLPAAPTQFLIAHLYADRGLYAEAVERLEGVSQNFRMAAVQKLLGDLRMDIGLPEQAEADYSNALQLAKAENDDEGQMLLHQTLATIYMYSVDHREVAGQHLNAMRDLARKLGDSSTAIKAGKLLAEMETASPTK